MEATRARQATIDDLIERLLDKGVIVNLDLVVGVAGIPLIGINLRAAIASIETMIEYGMMNVWDEQLRDYASKEIQKKKMALTAGETVLLDLYGSNWYSNGIYRSWRPGRLYLTEQRLILYRKEPAEVLFQTQLAEIRDLAIVEETYFTGVERDLLYMALTTGELVALYAEDVEALHADLVAQMAAIGCAPAGSAAPFLRDREVSRQCHEETIADGKLWYQAPGGGILGATWRPGWLYLTAERLIWWSDFERRIALELPVAKIRRINLETRDLGGFLDRRQVLSVVTQDNGQMVEVLLAGDALPQWQRQIKEKVLDSGDGGFDA